MLKVYKSIIDQGLVLQEKFVNGSWIRSIDPSADEIKQLVEWGIDPDLINYSLDMDEMPRMERDEDEDYVFLLLRVLWMAVIIYATIDNVLMPIWYGNAVGSTNGILYHYAAPKNAANDFLVANTKPRYGVNPDLFDGDGMSAAIMLVEALKLTNGDTTGEALVAVMEGMTFEGAKGTYYIRPEDHVAIQDMYILKLINVTDPDANFYEFVATTRPEPPCLLPENLKDRCGSLPYGSLSGE